MKCFGANATKAKAIAKAKAKNNITNEEAKPESIARA